MKRQSDDEFEDLRNIDIDDIFENDSEEFEIENDSVEESSEDLDISDEAYDQYMFDNDYDNKDKDEEKEETVEDSPDEKELSFNDDMLEDSIESENETTQTEEIPVEVEENVETSEESVEENSKEEPNVENVTINEDDDPMLEIEDEKDTSSNIEPEAETVVEKTEQPSVELKKEEPESEEIKEVTVESTKGTETEDEQKSEEKIDEPVIKKPEEYDNILDVEINNSKQYIFCKNDDEKQSIDEIVKNFRNTLDFYYKKYHEQDLINYINDFIDKDVNRAVFSDIYIMQYCKYSIAIDFKNPVAEQNLWVIAAGMFADKIEEDKRCGFIQSDVVSEGARYNPENIVEDKGIALNKAYKKAQDAKYSQYKLDRTIFNIREEDDENTSIFEDKRTLYRDFCESEFYSIHKEVMTSDRFADMNSIYSNIIIDEVTSFVPIIDYSTGIRVICIDTNDTDQYHLNPLIIGDFRRVPFSYQVNSRNVKTRILYLDDCKYRPMAVICSLKKLIAFDKINPRYKISLAHNYVVAYTTEAKWIELFEKGDPDTRSPENSTYYMSKPSNMCIGIIVLDKKSDKDKRSIRRHQIARDLGREQEIASADDYNIQFVISARISRNDLRLRNPTIPREDRYVEYTITQYNECNPVIISDGFQTLVACIIREHKNNYDPGTPYSISFEYDRDGLVSPAVVKLMDEQNGIEPAYGTRPNSKDIDGMFTLPPSRIKMGGVFEFEHGRLDKRYFTPASIQRKYEKPLWASYDLTTKDGRIQFIKSRGFEEFIHLKPLVFDVMPYALNMLESSETYRELIKVSLPMLADRNSQDSEAILFKQAELNYKKSLGNSSYGKFKIFMVEALDIIIDMLGKKNN